MKRSLSTARLMGRRVGIALVCVCGPLVTVQAQSERTTEKAVPVFVATARQDMFSDRIEALGTLRANESVTLTATVAETVRAIHFEDGQRVEKGQVLAEMTSAEEHALLEEARAESKEAALQFERLRPLMDRGAVPASTADERKRNLQTAEARLRAIESRLDDRLIVAPFAGKVGLRNISVGALVSPGDVITTLDDDSIMKLDFSVPSVFLSSLKPGLKIVARGRGTLKDAYEGTLSSIDSRIDQATRSVLVRAVLPNEERSLVPGLLMTVELVSNPRQALMIPEEALIALGKKSFVLRVLPQGEGSSVERREVVLGARRPGEVEIVGGLNAGDTVVVHGTMQARPGVPIRILSTLAPGQSVEEVLKSLTSDAA
ncbi:MAG: efflux RND transporter periplasmic adaptor subunit [Bdellovibrionota bacterium]|nr:MAG: efflux RND transporter periplasmic adaptor subunit [Bdellovibrionota bacterium]